MKILSYIHLIFCNFYSFRYNIHTHCLDHTLAALVKKLLAFQTNQLVCHCISNVSMATATCAAAAAATETTAAAAARCVNLEQEPPKWLKVSIRENFTNSNRCE